MAITREITVSYVSNTAGGRPIERRTVLHSDIGRKEESLAARVSGTLKTVGASARKVASAGVNSAVPLKRITAGRKELSILHDGATYLLRVTKANKLILTKVIPSAV